MSEEIRECPKCGSLGSQECAPDCEENKLEILLTLTSEMFHDADDIPMLGPEDGPFWYDGAWPEVGDTRWFFAFNRQPKDMKEAFDLVMETYENEGFDRDEIIGLYDDATQKLLRGE